jgi:hypothetical protein
MSCQPDATHFSETTLKPLDLFFCPLMFPETETGDMFGSVLIYPSDYQDENPGFGVGKTETSPDTLLDVGHQVVAFAVARSHPSTP